VIIRNRSRRNQQLVKTRKIGYVTVYCINGSNIVQYRPQITQIVAERLKGISNNSIFYEPQSTQSSQREDFL
jgi:hypothetical protein